MKLRIFGIMLMLLATFSCVKENEQELQPVNPEDERFAEFDPVVRFGLDTYMGGADDNEPLTKTTYAGDDKTIVLNKVRYERINWNGTSESNPDDPAYQDVIQIISQTNFTPKNDKPSVSYKVVAIHDWTNPSGNNREDYADAEPYSGSADDYFYWSRPAGSKDTDKHYFYAVYPTHESLTGRPDTQVTNFSLDTSDSDPAKHFAKFSGYINKRVEPSPGENPGADADCRKQKYLAVESYTDSDSGKNCHEYLPDMKNAFLYASAAMPGADAGYKKVPLRFKPLYSAVKIMVSAGDEGAKKYRLKRVDLRTDLHNNGSKEGRADLNDDNVGTALGGSFSTYFKAATSGTTADFAKIDPSTDTNTSLSDTLKRLFIEIKPEHYKVLGDNVLKFTFLVLPIEQRVMTVEYTFEYLKGSELDPSDPEYLNPAVDANWTANPGKIVEVHRYLSLQQQTTKTTGEGNIFSDNDWFKLPPATKLYVKSNVPEIQYFFDIQVRGNFPRTWNSGDDKDATNHFYSDDFYSVQSYCDSAGVKKQPLRWKVTGYKRPGDAKYEMGNRPSWLRLRGDDYTWDETDAANRTDPYNPASGVVTTGDPWEYPWGAGTPMENGDFAKTSKFDHNKRNYIKGTSFVSYTAAAENNGSARNESVTGGKPDVFGDNRDWDTPVSYLFKDLDGKYYYQDNHTHTPSAGWAGLKDEAYAYDLSSHDIYGNLTVTKNGDVGTTANCYVVSAPGWYRFPAVYGNALKGGSPNSPAYTGVTGVDGIMGAFLNHNNVGITSPEISGISSVDVLWDDTQGTAASTRHLVARHITTSSRADRGAFYHKEPTDTYGYIYFYVDDIAQGNAVIAAYSGTTIVWSWHIWAVTKPETYLKEVALYTNLETLNPWDPIDDAEAKFIINYSNFIVNPPSAADVTDDLTEPRISRVNPGTFWKMADLGQNGNESGNVEPRYCDVEFTQYFRGKEVKKVVRRFLQSGVKDQGDGSDTAPKYQWGRKDPFKVEFLELKHADPADPASYVPTERTGENIQRPTLFYYGDAKYPPTDKRYDNLWNTNVTEPVLNSYASGRAGGSQDRQVEKTIYDPSPVGYSLPNMYAYSAFNPYGAISNVKFPAPLVDEIAKNPETWSSNYVDFYAGYKEGAKYKRDKDGETIRIYFTGRIKATGKPTDTEPPGQIMKPTAAYYWTSEPAKFEGYYGRSFSIDNNFNPTTVLSKSGAYWSLWPVAGGNYDYIQSGYCPKWQRTHGHAVRPMRNP